MRRARIIFPLTGLLLAATVVLGQSPAKKTARQKAAPSIEIVRGKKVYDTECKICHFSTSTAKKIGPGLQHLYSRGKFADGSKVDDESLRAWIEKGGKDMPGFKESLRAEQIRDLIAYMKSL